LVTNARKQIMLCPDRPFMIYGDMLTIPFKHRAQTIFVYLLVLDAEREGTDLTNFIIQDKTGYSLKVIKECTIDLEKHKFIVFSK